MKFLDLFSGIGGFRLAMERAGHECVGFCEIDKYARASYKAMYDTKGEKEYHDITGISDDDFRLLNGHVDIITGGFPCQAFSMAGNRRGFDDTRGTLFFDVARAAKAIQPSFLLLENVKGLLNHDKGNTFKTIIATLDELGYGVEWGVFNSKFWGVPQNRERVILLCTRQDLEQKHFRLFDLLKRQETATVDVRLKDILETHVDEKFYLSKPQTDKLVLNSNLLETGSVPDINQIGKTKSDKRDNPNRGRVYDENGLSPTLNCMEGGGLQPHIKENVSRETIQTPVSYNRNDGVKKEIDRAYALNASDHRGLNRNQDQNVVMETVKIKEAVKAGYKEAKPGDGVDVAHLNSTTRRGRVGDQIAQTLTCKDDMAVVIGASRGRDLNGSRKQRLETNGTDASNALTTVQKDNYVIESKEKFGRMGRQAADTFNEKPCGSGDTINPYNKTVDTSGNSPTLTTRPEGFKTAVLPVVEDEPKSPTLRIRKLTPRECFRLQAFPDELFDKAEKVNSNSQLYKQAGNSVTVSVIEAVAKTI